MNISKFHNDILGWYEKHQRTLPWRMKTPNPYRTWVSEIMLQQTTVPTVIPYFQRFLETWPTVQDLANAPLDDVLHLWQGLGYYSRARNLHKCAKKIVEDFQGIFPEDEALLKKLPGIGDYTAAAIRSIAFNQPSVVIDGNIERVISRLFLINDPLPTSKPIIKTQATKIISHDHPGDYAQALMDLGSLICTPTSPKCLECPIESHCKAKGKNPEAYPKRLAKAEKPQRYGSLFWIENDKGEVLIEKRPEKGLLAGLMGFPTTEWTTHKDDTGFPFKGSWQKMPQPITHTFTHFHLTLEVYKGTTTKKVQGLWVKREDFHRYAIPTLMKKAIKLVLITSL
jgi:A/G-specific adenine glycosylase